MSEREPMFVEIEGGVTVLRWLEQQNVVADKPLSSFIPNPTIAGQVLIPSSPKNIDNQTEVKGNL